MSLPGFSICYCTVHKCRIQTFVADHMPRSRESEMPQRPSPHRPHVLRTNSDSDALNHRAITERSPKITDRNSPRVSQPDSLNQKKLGTRIADLESQLSQAQEELKVLKDKLASAEVAKKEAQQHLEKKNRSLPIPEPEETHDKHPSTDDVNEVADERSSSHKLMLKDATISTFKAQLEEKENELEACRSENEDLKNLLSKATSEHASAEAKEQKTSVRLSQLMEELEASKANAAELMEKLSTVKGAKEALEDEMKTMRVHTKQWRKAADAAAAVLAGGMEMSSRISGRCSSMDNHFGGIFETPSIEYTGFGRSPEIADECNDRCRSAKQRSSSGIKVFGDLLRRKTQK